MAKKANDKGSLFASRMTYNQVDVTPDAPPVEEQKTVSKPVEPVVSEQAPQSPQLGNPSGADEVVFNNFSIRNKNKASKKKPDKTGFSATPVNKEESLQKEKPALRKEKPEKPQKEPKIKEPKIKQPKEKASVFRAKKNSLPEDDLFTISDSSKITDEELVREYEEKHNLEMEESHHFKMSTRVFNTLLIAGCVYLIFLIYGVIITEYHYDDSGRVVAQQMSVEDIREKKEYEIVLAQYTNCRILYENVLLLDYRLSAGEEDPLTIAPEYEALLEDVTNLSIKTSALSVDTKYSQIKEMMLSWIQNDIALYLQNMSDAISLNDVTTANNALQDRDRTYNNFMLIAQNMIAMGNSVEGVDLTDVKSWTPETYIDKKINSK